MEFGGVGKPAGCLLDGRDFAATAAKLSLPAQKVVLYGFGMSTEAVIPAKAIAMLEVLLVLLVLLIGAIVGSWMFLFYVARVMSVLLLIRKYV